MLDLLGLGDVSTTEFEDADKDEDDADDGDNDDGGQERPSTLCKRARRVIAGRQKERHPETLCGHSCSLVLSSTMAGSSEAPAADTNEEVKTAGALFSSPGLCSLSGWHCPPEELGSTAGYRESSTVTNAGESGSRPGGV